MGELKRLKVAPPKSAKSTMETALITRQDVTSLVSPPFQRPTKVNDKVRGIAEQMRCDGGIVPGVITIGVIKGDDRVKYKCDGAHRLEAFLISGLTEAIADIRTMEFDSMGAMAAEFVRLNSAIARMRPDDLLRGMEGSAPALRVIREACPFVGYEHIRRTESSGPVVSMSAVLRCWASTAGEVPGSSTPGSAQLAADMDVDDAKRLAEFLQHAAGAWGRDPEYYRMWGNLNLAMCMWLWRQTVLNKERGVKRFVRLTPEQFRRCLMAVSSNSEYLDWLVGRNLGDRDRSPCYKRLKAIFSRRLKQDSQSDKTPLFPQTTWAAN